jgi:hypothetical protein
VQTHEHFIYMFSWILSLCRRQISRTQKLESHKMKVKHCWRLIWGWRFCIQVDAGKACIDVKIIDLLNDQSATTDRRNRYYGILAEGYDNVSQDIGRH